MENCSKCEFMIKSVYANCKLEEVNPMKVPAAKCIDRVSHYTGCPKSEILRVIKDHTETEDYAKTLSTRQYRILISQTLIQLYSKHVDFDYIDIYKAMKQEIYLDNEDGFRIAMANLGYQSVGNGRIVLEDPKLRFERFDYLKKILKLRQKGKHIYYLNELLFEITNEGLIIHKPSAENVSSEDFEFHPKFLYVCSSDGCQNSLFCFQMPKDDYKKWLVHSLIPSLKHSSVIVMDNNVLHGTLADTHITRYHSKDDMMRWLDEYNIPCNSDMHKAELFELIDKCPFKNTDYKIARLFKANHHQVLRLPCQLHQLSMSTMMFEEIKNTLPTQVPVTDPTHKQKSLIDIKIKLFDAINAISEQKWMQFSKTLHKDEKTIFDIDCELEDVLDKNFVIDISSVLFDKSCELCDGREKIVIKWLQEESVPT